MNILLLSPNWMYTDIENLSHSFGHNMAKSYATLGHKVRVIIPVAYGKKREGKRWETPIVRVVKDDVELIFLRYITLSRFGVKLEINLRGAMLSVFLHRKKLIQDFCPEVIHVHTLGFYSKLGCYMKAIAGCPLVVTTHGSDTAVPFNAGKMAYLQKSAVDVERIVKFYDRIYHVLETYKEVFRNIREYAEENITWRKTFSPVLEYISELKLNVLLLKGHSV